MNRAQCHIEHYPHFNEFDCICQKKKNASHRYIFPIWQRNIQCNCILTKLAIICFCFFFVNHLHSSMTSHYYMNESNRPFENHLNSGRIHTVVFTMQYAVASMVGYFLTVHLSLNMNLLPIGLFFLFFFASLLNLFNAQIH